MRILLLNEYYPPDPAPTGLALHELARALAGRGHRVRVVCSPHAYRGPGRYAAEEILDGIEVRRTPATPLDRPGLAAQTVRHAAYLAFLARELFLSGPRPDVIVALTTPPFLGALAAAAAAARRTGLVQWVMDLYPDVLVAHGMLRPRGLAYRILQALTRWQLSSARLVLSLGPHAARKVSAYAGPDTRSIAVPLWGPAPDPWPQGTPNPVRQERGWPDEELVLMYSGNMGRGHRFGEFLAAARRLGPEGPRWAFVGDGPRRRDIEAFARTHPGARVELHPAVAGSRIREGLGAADVHLVSLDSAWQGLIVPSKIQGIFGAGRPAIFVGCRDNEVASWIEESGGGWVVPEGDVDALLVAVREAREPAERARRGEAALRFARVHFRRDRNCGRIARLVEAAASERAARALPAPGPIILGNRT